MVLSQEANLLSPPAEEEPVLLRNVRWATYRALLSDLGDHGGRRLTFDRGLLEIMSPSSTHERLKRIIGRFVEALTEELGVEIRSGGSTTFKSNEREQGLEPDECYYLQGEPKVRGKEKINLTRDPPPDLAIEIDITSSSLDRFGIYAGFKIPEVWRYNGERLKAYRLKKRGMKGGEGYAEIEKSLAFPALPLEGFVRFLARRNDLSENRLIREFRAWVRSGFAKV